MNVDIIDRENVVSDGINDGMAQTLQYISTSQEERDNFDCSIISDDTQSQETVTERCEVLERPNIISREEANDIIRQKQISYVEVPNLAFSNGQQFFDISHLETFLGPQFKQINPQDFLLDSTQRYPDLLNHPSTSNPKADECGQVMKEPRETFTCSTESYILPSSSATSSCSRDYNQLRQTSHDLPAEGNPNILARNSGTLPKR